MAAAVVATLMLGSSAASANQTADVQRKLGVPADGVMGPQTKRAIKRFQRAHGLEADGIVGPKTLAALGLSARKAVESSTSASGSVRAVLERIAECESGGDPTLVSSSGQYRGKYQFSRSTWHAMGGTGDPAKADEAEQDRLARALYRAQGTAPWPVCGGA